MAPQLSDFTFSGAPLTLTQTERKNCKTALELTTWIVNELRQSKQNNVQALLEKHRNSCTNCFYSGRGPKCSFVKKAKELEERREREKTGDSQPFTFAIAMAATSVQRETWKKILEETIKARTMEVVSSQVTVSTNNDDELEDDAMDRELESIL
ncbi:5b25fbbe-c402-44dd-bb22-a785d5d977ff [Thermothielavioides terrestris]|uniref:5b25fbbe-c402-44dd-bb22-a785d5d977ff n=1 Tax=Thermothielavioides terrestris TaxID=2587410 RepID=A0A446BKX8_9PEZI|nr:5b25fbbe-c402-44dd-bb22-a785d5d977ff [Thermothielavioides terrestris]